MSRAEMEKSCLILTAFDENRTRFPGGRLLPGRGVGELRKMIGISEIWEYKGFRKIWGFFILTNQGKYAIIHADIFA
jgi:hypothetical protein